MGGDNHRPLIPVITGPTGIGKTAVAAALAQLAPIEIVSADSRQVYRGLDIGTAKPVGDERAAAPHHGLDLIAPGETYSAGRFGREAVQWIVGAGARGRLPVVVGGTGFYLRALFDGLFDEPTFDEARRERLRGVLGALPAEEQMRWARRLDAAFAGSGSHRALRAVEIALLSGSQLSRLQEESPPPIPPFRPWYVLLALPREALTGRIALRTRAMLETGLVLEVRRILNEGAPPDAPGLSAVGYPEVIAHLSGELTADALFDSIIAATRRYAKRQATWFRHQLRGPVMELDASQPPEALAQALLSGYRAALDADGQRVRESESR